MDDKLLLDVSRDIDNIISMVGTKYEIDALSLSSIILARLMWINREVGYESDFRKLLAAVSTDKFGDRGTVQ